MRLCILLVPLYVQLLFIAARKYLPYCMMLLQLFCWMLAGQGDAVVAWWFSGLFSFTLCAELPLLPYIRKFAFDGIDC